MYDACGIYKWEKKYTKGESTVEATKSNMEDVQEKCLCHGIKWISRIELLDHQVSFYQRQAWESQQKAEVYRLALRRAGIDSTTMDQREENCEEGR